MSKNRRSKNIFKKKANGITLIALVVTIIVLLILAGISIMMLTGNNGILTRAGDAKEETIVLQEKEQVELAYIQAANKDRRGDVTKANLQSELDSLIGDSKTSVKGTNTLYVHFNDTNHDYTIMNGTIEYEGTLAGNKILLTVTQTETESRAVKLKVTATIDGIEAPEPSELEYELDPEGTGDTDELKDMFLKALNTIYSGFGMNFSSWSELESSMQLGTQTPSSVFEMLKDSLPMFGCTSTEMYPWMIEMEAYKPAIILKLSNGEEITVFRDSGEFVITTNGTYTIVASDEDGDYGKESIKISKCLNRSDNKVETYTKKETRADAGKNSKTVTALDNKPVEVPAGFYYGTSNNVGKVSTGFVITDSVDDRGNSIGNEFVWIPVDKTTLKVIGSDGALTDKVMAKESTGDYAGTDSNGRTNYEGVLYNFSGTGSETTSSEMSNYGQNTSNNREPGLTYHDEDDTNEYLEGIGFDATSFKNALITEYNAMIESVKTYGGFYVARYEMGAENNKPISKLGTMPFAMPGISEGGTWYDGFKLGSNYETSFVKSSMIWGSQYDAMLNFALTGIDKNKVTANTNGAHGGVAYKTGLYEGSDVICNIYDIEGNWPEYTMEACDYGYRIVRQYSNRGEDPSASTRWATGPRNYRMGTETRLTFYIK